MASLCIIVLCLPILRLHRRTSNIAVGISVSGQQELEEYQRFSRKGDALESIGRGPFGFTHHFRDRNSLITKLGFENTPTQLRIPETIKHVHRYF